MSIKVIVDIYHFSDFLITDPIFLTEGLSTVRGFGRGQGWPLTLEAGKGQVLSLPATIGSGMEPRVASQMPSLGSSCSTAWDPGCLAFPEKDPVRVLTGISSLVFTILSVL